MRKLTLHGLTVEQSRELADHLRTALPASRLVHAVSAIDLACWKASVELEHGPELRHQAETARAHFEAMQRDVDNLRARLAHERPLVQTAGLDWSLVDQALATIRRSTELEIEGRPPLRRHRPAFSWRDELIAVIFSVYPTRTATKSRGGHFEQTVEMALGYLNREVENVHSVVVAALKRCPEPPFVLTVKDGVVLP